MQTLTEHFQIVYNGPISDITLRKKPWTTLQHATRSIGATINDPRYGGLFGFGAIVAEPQAFSVTPDQYWNHCWEITTRQADINNNKTTLRVNNYELFDVEWRYDFQDHEITATVTITPLPNETLLIKEPKLVFNGFLGYQNLVALDAKANRLGQYRLDAFPDPRKRTIQVHAQQRTAFVLLAPDRPSIRVYIKPGQWDLWYHEADADPIHDDRSIDYHNNIVPAPAYCLDKGHLKSQTEIPHWGAGNTNVTGIVDHCWEGGYGAPDCWNCFRKFPTRPVEITASIRIN